jgi:hypothetical protein
MPKASLREKIKSQIWLPTRNAGPPPHLALATAPAQNNVLQYEIVDFPDH